MTHALLRIGLTTALAGAALGVVAASPASAVTTNQTYWVPVDGTVTVRGHGFGHGHGMSQYGAEGAALQGLGYKQIVDFYYPGTTWSSFTGTVRVLITADTTSDIVVSPAAGLTVRDLGSGTTYPLPALDGVKRWRLTVDPATNRTVVGYLTTRWHRWKPGGLDALVGDGQFRAAGPLTLWTPYGARSYRGALRAASPYPGSPSRDTVNVVSMDKYVKGVVPNEMPASWQQEAVRAQAVAARTYATWSRAQYPSRYYQICDTSSCQVYGGSSSEDARSNAAVDATAGQILTYGGRPAFTQFGSSSGGWTSAGGPPYLPAEQDPYDGTSLNPVHSWSTTVDLRRLQSIYPQLGTLRSIEVTSRDGHGEWQGRVWGMVLDGTSSNVTISGETFSSLYGLRSSWFSFDPTPIIARWSRLGGPRSPLGQVRSGEYAAGTGSAQRFADGRIYYSRATGAHELYGKLLAGYRALGGPASPLGMPVTGARPQGDGWQATFQHGGIWSSPASGTVTLLRAIASRYRAEGGVQSALGWPTGGNRTTSTGRAATFQHGTITWSRTTGRTTVHLS